jgi:hypothetical protein
MSQLGFFCAREKNWTLSKSTCLKLLITDTSIFDSHTVYFVSLVHETKKVVIFDKTWICG